MQAALDAEWPWLDELFDGSRLDAGLVESGVAVDPAALRERGAGPDRAGRHRGDAARSPRSTPAVGGGRRGLHTEEMGYLLAEMQHLHRSHPGATW